MIRPQRAILLCLIWLSAADLSFGETAATAPAGAPLAAVFFHSPTCLSCQKVQQRLTAIETRWRGRVIVEQYSVADASGLERLLLYEKRYGIEARNPPVVFVGDQCLAKAETILAELEDAIAAESAAGRRTWRPEMDESACRAPGSRPGEVLARFRRFRVGAVIAAGLLDGVNPCAFTTIIFLLSMLAFLGKSGKELAAVGVGFTAAVFATYFALGLGLLETVKVFAVAHGVSVVLAYAVGVLALALAAWSLVDCVRFLRTGNAGAMTLGLPKGVKERIRRVIRVGLSARGLMAGSLGVGVAVALLESLCTGQVYLPTIVLVARDPELRGRAIAYLLLYNVMFILPLVAILAIAACGVSSRKMGDFLRRHLAAAKLAMAVLFAVLGAMVLLTV